MSNVHAIPKKTVPGFWTRLALAVTEVSESPAERLERRVSQLEAEVERLSANQKKPART